MAKPSARNRPSPRSAAGGGRRPARSNKVLPALAGVVVAMAAVSVLIGLAAGSGDKTSAASQTGTVEVAGRGLPPFQSPAADPAVGQPAPEILGQGFDGRRLDIVADGAPKVVVFLAHWCPHCQAEVPRIVDWLAVAPPRDVELVAVSTAVDRARPNYPPSAWLEREGWTVPTVADDPDGTAARAFGLTSYPFFVAVGADGAVRARISGELTVAQLEALVETARG
jgi:cytochrome c biogenesis protein CcmG, thiol:disulfide interchange protein DsbE